MPDINDVYNELTTIGRNIDEITGYANSAASSLNALQDNLTGPTAGGGAAGGSDAVLKTINTSVANIYSHLTGASPSAAPSSATNSSAATTKEMQKTTSSIGGAFRDFWSGFKSFLSGFQQAFNGIKGLFSELLG